MVLHRNLVLKDLSGCKINIVPILTVLMILNWASKLCTFPSLIYRIYSVPRLVFSPFNMCREKLHLRFEYQTQQSSATWGLSGNATWLPARSSASGLCSTQEPLWSLLFPPPQPRMAAVSWVGQVWVVQLQWSCRIRSWGRGGIWQSVLRWGGKMDGGKAGDGLG